MVEAFWVVEETMWWTLKVKLKAATQAWLLRGFIGQGFDALRRCRLMTNRPT